MSYHDPRKMMDADLTAALMTAARIESDDLYLFADELDYRLRTRKEALEAIVHELDHGTMDVDHIYNVARDALNNGKDNGNEI